MDGFMNLAKQGYAAYEKSQGQSNVQGGSQYNAGAGNQGADLDLQGAANSAKSQASHQDSSLFDTALSFLQQKKDSGDTDVDEDAVQNDHHQVYDKGNASNMSANSIGAAAAMQALKQFTSGGGASSTGSSSGGGGGMQAMLMGKAMAEAAKMFDSTPNGAQSGNKQDAVSSAGATVMKLLLKSKFSTTGASNSGGLAGLASQFL